MSDVAMSKEQEQALVAVYQLTKLGGDTCALLEKLAAKLKWDESRVRRVMSELVELGMLNRAGSEGPN